MPCTNSSIRARRRNRFKIAQHKRKLDELALVQIHKSFQWCMATWGEFEQNKLKLFQAAN